MVTQASVFALFIVSSSELSAQVVINEVLASNRRAVLDEDGDTPDFIELYNVGTEDVSLAGYGLSDDETEPYLWVLPDVSLPPRGYLLIWCSGKDRVTPANPEGPEKNAQPISHTNFRLASGGERIFLNDQHGAIADELNFPSQSPDHSFGRSPDGTGEFQYLVFPTPLAPNDSNTSSEPIPDLMIEFEPESGKYSEPFDVTLTTGSPLDGLEIRYTAEGSPPTADSSLYEAPITIDQDTVIRAAGLINGRLVTPIVSKSYFGFKRRLRQLVLPIMSISMPPKDFQTVHLDVGAQGREAEREAYLEIFNKDGTPAVASGIGLRLHGNRGRQGGDMSIKKAYRAYFRGVYGNPRLKYPVIPDTQIETFDKLVLRANFDDSFRLAGGYIRDQVTRDLHADMGGAVSHGTWYNLFVNMEFRGLYNVVERIDTAFLRSYFTDDGESWDVIKQLEDVLDGDELEWQRMKKFMLTSDLRDDALYEKALDLIDLERFISYTLVQMWSANHGWPGFNWYAARPRIPDGKWTWFVWDAEEAFDFGLIRANSFDRLFSTNYPTARIFSSLLRSPRCQRYFLEELDRYLAGPLSRDHVLQRIETQKQNVGPDIAEEAGLFDTIGSWKAQVEEMKRFARERGEIFRNFVISSEQLTLPVATAITPDRIVQSGEAAVTLEGFRFTDSTEVSFGDLPSPKVEFVSSTELRVTVPFDISLQGFPAINLMDPDGGSSTANGLLEIEIGSPPLFRRGDADGNGRENVTDAVKILRYLFGREAGPFCDDAVDVDDNGTVNLTDAVFLLGYLLRPDSPVPPGPLSSCGTDKTPDSLSCLGPTSCN